MRLAGFAVPFVVALAAAIVVIVTFAEDTSAPAGSRASIVALATATGVPLPTPVLPDTWIDALAERPRSALGPLLLSCLDTDGDGRLTPRDGPPVYAGVDIMLKAGEACLDPGASADFFESIGAPLSCDANQRAVFVYVIAGAGTDLADARGGESLGLLDTLNLLLFEAARRGIVTRYVISTAALFGAEMPQTSMERFIGGHIAERLAGTPCARAVMIGHSHGGVTVTSVLAAIEDRFAYNVLGVLVDRTTALYDRPAQEMPSRARLFNFFQTNEGWHGVAIDGENVRNFDESAAVAPIALSDGGGGPAVVTHKTLDDARDVQARIVAEVMAWLTP